MANARGDCRRDGGAAPSHVLETGIPTLDCRRRAERAAVASTTAPDPASPGGLLARNRRGAGRRDHLQLSGALQASPSERVLVVGALPARRHPRVDRGIPPGEWSLSVAAS